MFVYLIDEAETFFDGQQRFLNSLICYRSGNASIKIGARLYGIRTYETLGTGEPIKRDAEYERVELDAFLRDHELEYKRLYTQLVIKRLSSMPARPVKLDDHSVRSFFEELDPTAYYRDVTLKMVQSADRSNKERPYFRRLRSEPRSIFRVPDLRVDEMITALSIRDYPLLEKLNLFLLYREWKRDFDELQQIADGIGAQARALLENGRLNAAEYVQTLDHFNSDLLAQLYRDCRRQVPYAGFSTLIHLSQGIPRNLLVILKHIYRRALFAGERPFSGGTIRVDSQSSAAVDSAAWFWEDAQPTSRGVEVREGIEALAVFFRTIRYSNKPAECDLCTFSVDFDKLSSNSQAVLETAENWSYLIRIREGAKNRNNLRVDTQFQLAPMLAPKWGVSEHRRGTIEIQPDFGNALFDYTCRESLPELFKRRVSGMLAPNLFVNKGSSQDELFP